MHQVNQWRVELTSGSYLILCCGIDVKTSILVFSKCFRAGF